MSRPSGAPVVHAVMVAGTGGHGYRPRIRTLHLTDGELADLVTSPLTVPELTDPLDHVVAIVRPGGAAWSGAALATLASLPCVVVADGADPDTPPAFADLVIEPGVATLDRVLATIEAHPTAAVTYALLLRGAAERSLGAGLVAESMAYSTLQSGPEFASWRSRTARRERPPETSPPVHVSRAGHRLEVVLDRPHVRNALDQAMRDALLEATTLAAADDTITEVVLRGNGPTFCSGGDLDEFGAFADPATAHLARVAGSIGRAIDRIADRTTAVLHGSCAGSGIELPAFAGTVIAARDTTFALPEVGLGLVPGAGGTVSITNRIGRHRTALLGLCGTAIDATTARRWGLVDHLDDLDG